MFQGNRNINFINNKTEIIYNYINLKTELKIEIKMESQAKTSSSKYFIYGMPRLSAGIVLDIVDFGILFLYITAYGLNPILSGIAIAIGKLSIAAGQFLMGWLSDSSKSKYGRRNLL